jgi:predicted dehydrogenase
MSDPVALAVVGLGYWGPNLARNVQEIPQARLEMLCDVDSTNLRRVQERYPAARATTSYDDVLADPDVEAVVLATPVGTHKPLAMAALQAGKHVFVEKPLAASSEDGREMVAAAEAAGRTLMPGHTFVYSPAVNVIRDLIIGGELGELYFISMSRVNLGIHQSDVGVVWDLGAHDFSILRYWLGEAPVVARGASRSCVVPGISDVAFVTLEYPAQVLAHAELSWIAPSKLRRTTVVGAHKMVVYDDTSNEPVRIFDSGADLRDPETFGEFRMTYRAGDIVSPRVDASEPLSLELADFCAAIREGREPRSSSALGLDVVRTIEAVEASVAMGGMPVALAGAPVPARA